VEGKYLAHVMITTLQQKSYIITEPSPPTEITASFKHGLTGINLQASTFVIVSSTTTSPSIDRYTTFQGDFLLDNPNSSISCSIDFVFDSGVGTATITTSSVSILQL